MYPIVPLQHGSCTARRGPKQSRKWCKIFVWVPDLAAKNVVGAEAKPTNSKTRWFFAKQGPHKMENMQFGILFLERIGSLQENGGSEIQL